MPVPHFNIKITQRSKGKSAVAGAAYQAGEKLFSEYDQKTKNYTCKKEVVYPRFEAAGGTPPYRKVRTDAPGIFKRSPPSQIEHIDLDQGVMDIPCRPERTGTGTVRHYHGANESCRGRDRGIKAHFSNGMGAALQ